MICLSATGFTGNAGAGKQNGIYIHSTEFRRRSALDTGSFRIFFRNDEKNTLTVSECGITKAASYSGTCVPNSGNMDTATCLYTRLSPPAVEPGGVGELLIKLKDEVNVSDSISCSFTTNNGGKYSVDLEPQPSPIEIASVGFPHEFDRAYVYIRNSGAEKIEITDIKINGFPVEKKSEL